MRFMKTPYSSLACFAFVLLVAGMVQPSAQGQVFVSDPNGGRGVVNEYTLSGSAIKTPFISTGNDISRIAISGTLLFTLDQADEIVGEYNAVTGATLNPDLITLGSGVGTGIAVGNNLIYVSTSSGLNGTLTAYSETATPTVAWTLTTGSFSSGTTGLGSPGNVVVSGTGLYVFCWASLSNAISYYNALTGAYQHEIFYGDLKGTIGPIGMAISGSDLYVSSYAGGFIGEYNTSGTVVSGSLVKGTPDGTLGLAICNNILYAAALGSVNMYNATTGAFSGSFTAGLSQADGVAIASDVYPFYFLNKTAQYVQTSTAAPVLLSGTGVNSPYMFQSILLANKTLPLASGSLTPPAGSTGGVTSYQIQPDGFGDLAVRATYPSAAAMNAAYLDGTYQISVTGSSGTNTPTMTLGGNFSPNVPTLTNTNWSGGALQVPAFANNIITWKALPDATVNDIIMLQVASANTGHLVSTQVLSATSTSASLPSPLPSGAYIAKLNYIKTSFTDSADIPSSIGYAGYENRLDFNINSLHEILWRNYATGQDLFWFMNGTTFVSSGTINTVADTSWYIVATADFKGDGNADILWTNYATGQNQIWIMSGTTFVSSVNLPVLADPNMSIVGAGDFNGDGKPDILLRNYATGQNHVWIMNGTNQVSTVTIAPATNTFWEVLGTADFLGNGNTDILWRNYITGQNQIWIMNGTTLVSTVNLPTVLNTSWWIAGTADFNGDGKPDILWRNYATGQNEVWFMSGTTFVSSQLLNNSVPVTAWQDVTVR